MPGPASTFPVTDVPPVRIDARGLLCPLPVLKARKALVGMAAGEILEIAADDPMAAIDMPHFCREAGHVLVEVRAAVETAGGAAEPGPLFVIRRG